MRGGAAARVIARPRHTLVCLEGEIDIATTEVLSGALRDATRTPASDIVVDLDGLEFLDSTGLRMLVSARDRLAADGRHLSVRRAHGAVSRLFELAGSV